jgi:hypothetical protein
MVRDMQRVVGASFVWRLEWIIGESVRGNKAYECNIRVDPQEIGGGYR